VDVALFWGSLILSLGAWILFLLLMREPRPPRGPRAGR
jgi:hypothetical protein